MGGRKNKKTKVGSSASYFPAKTNGHAPSRNLLAKDLGGVIFGCTHETMAECRSEQLFGLPMGHISYVQNIRPGLPLFLFNYSDRTLHGIFEAVSNGQKHINPYAWTDGSHITPYPAQVRIRTRVHCNPVAENLFKKVIERNYNNDETPHHFWFELDKAQTDKLIALFRPSKSSVNKWQAQSRADLNVATVSMPTSSEKKELETSSLAAENIKNELVSSSSTMTWKDIVSGKQPTTEYTKNVSLIKTSCNVPVDIESRSVANWEDLVDDEQNVSSGESTATATESTYAMDINCAANYETFTMTDSLNTEENALNTYSNGCKDDDIINSSHADDENNGSAQGTEGSPLLLYDDYGTDTAVEFANAYNYNNQNPEVERSSGDLKDCIAELKSRQAGSDHEIQLLKAQLSYSCKRIEFLENRVKELVLKADQSKHVDESLDTFVKQCLVSEDVIYLIGGFNGSSWLSSFDSFSPSLDIITSLKPMSYARSYASAVSLEGNIFVFGGRNGKSCSDTVEYYNRRDDEWITCPSMLNKKASLSAATYNGKIYAIGGGDDRECLSDVEMLDHKYGKWSATRPMLHKRFASAAAELNGVVYAAGGYNGHEYLRSVEKLDPREGIWRSISDMNVRRGSHSMVALNEKLCCFGGFDGERMTSSTETYEPRTDSWIMNECMKFDRGYAGAAVLENAVYAIGGTNYGKLVDTVECYKEGAGWSSCAWKSIGKRSFFCAVVL